MKNELVEEKTSLIHNYLLPIYIIVSILYLNWRIDIAQSWHTWYAYPLIFCDIYGIFITIISLITTRRIAMPIWRPPLENTNGIDVFIPTYNEPEYIVKMTAIGAKDITGIRNVYILDDGNRKNIKELAQKLGVKYLARGVNTHAKAGNMNYGLDHSDAEYIICLDCDHVPQKNFIERTLGYFQDEKLALVQTPQVFYNTESFQFRRNRYRHLWNEQTMFYESIQPAKNVYNAGFFCGSGAIIRRSALDSVGGFATGTATEDIHTSLRLHAKGWNSLFLSEKLAHGLAPEDLTEYHKQRVRWGAGSLGLLFRSSDSPLVARGLSLGQRLCYFMSTITFLNGLQKLIYYIVPILMLAIPSAYSLRLNVPLLTYLGIFVPFILFSHLITFIYSRRTFHPVLTEQFNIANMFSSLVAVRGILNVQKKFSVSNKGKKVKDKSLVLTTIVLLWMTMVIAEIFSLNYLLYLHEDITSLTSSLVVVALIWNTFNIIHMGLFIRYINSYSRAQKNEHIQLPFEINASHEMSGRFITSISLKGVEVISDELLNLKNINITLKRDASDITLIAKIASSEKQIDNRYLTKAFFENLSLNQEKELTLFLFQRVVATRFKKNVVNSEPGNVGFLATKRQLSGS